MYLQLIYKYVEMVLYYNLTFVYFLYLLSVHYLDTYYPSALL